VTTPLLTLDDFRREADRFRKPWHDNYLAMYSSLFGGIVTDPVLMLVPVDDHLVHRSDGVFDVFKCVNGKAYGMTPHLDRLQRSSLGIDLAWPVDRDGLERIIGDVVRAGGEKDCMVRIMISRGPGGFTTNPYECPASQLYVVVTRLKPLPEAWHRDGVVIISADQLAKTGRWATIKSVNYLQNVMVKKAAVEAGVDFAVTWDDRGYLAEGATENIMLVSPDRELLVPEFDRVLRGVTVTRVMELARELVADGRLTAVRTSRIDRATAQLAEEVMLCGTSLNVLPVSRWDDRPVGDGRPGPVARSLMALLERDVRENPDMQTDLFASL
jgi:branched-chain amino acid aminotransferase